MIRLDEFLCENKTFDSRTKAKQAIERGEILVDGKVVYKPATLVDKDKISFEYKASKIFVSLGGYKLDKALEDFNFKVNNLTCADVGCSTGGFTDCLLQRGAKKVFCVDINDQLLHEKLLNDKRVFFILENAKNLDSSKVDRVDLIVADLSFISATSVLKVFYDLLEQSGHVILLIKPQFENDKKIKFKNGIIKDKKVREDACVKVISHALDCGFNFQNITTAPINKNKNVEFLVLLSKGLEKNILNNLEIFNIIHKITNNC